MSRTLGIQRPMERRGRHRNVSRAAVRIYATPDSIDDSFVLESTNVSGEGVFLHTDLLFPVGEWLELEFDVPGRVQPIRSRGRVVRVDARSEPPGPGVAVLIPRLHEEERNALGRLGTTAWRIRP